MKKIIMLMFILVFLFSFDIKLNAKDNDAIVKEEDIIAEVGSGKDSILFTDGVKEVTTNVDWNKTGNYQVLCTKDNGDIFVRNVYVKEKNSLENGFDILKEIGTLDFYLNLIEFIESYKVYPINEKEYLAYYNCIMKDGSKASFLSKYTKNEVSKLYMFEGETSVCDICFYNDNILVLINSFENSLSKILIYKFDINLSFKSNYKFKSNRNDEGKRIYFYNNSLYLILNTNSNDGFINRSPSNKIILFLKLNPLNFSISDSLIIANSYDNYLIECNCSDGNMTILAKLNGSSGEYYHSINKSYNGYFIINVNEKMKLNVLKNLENECENYSEITFDNEKLLLIWKENDRKIALKWGYYNEEKLSSIEGFNDKISSISSLVLNDNAYIFVSIKNKLSKIINLKGEYVITKNVFLSSDCVDVINKNELIYLVMESEKNTLYAYENIKIEKKDSEINYDKESIYYEKISLYINDYEVETSEMIPDFSDKFGNHYIENIAYSDRYLISYMSKYTVPLLINIRDGETYDPEFKIVFNGLGKLNNVNIKSGFIIKDIGKYQLEISGENGELEIINFEIIDKCVEAIEEENKENLSLEFIAYENSKSNYIVYDVYKKDGYINNSKDKIISLSVLLILIYIGILIFLRKKYRKKRVK